MAAVDETPTRRQFAKAAIVNAWVWFKGFTDSLSRLVFLVVLFGAPAAAFSGLDRWPVGLAIGAGLIVLVSIGEGSYRAWSDVEASSRAARASLAESESAPVSEAHQRRLLSVIQGLLNDIGNGNAPLFTDDRGSKPDYVMQMINGHFPELLTVVDKWNLTLADLHHTDKELRAAWESTIQQFNQPPWSHLPLRSAFGEYLTLLKLRERSVPGIPEPPADLEVFEPQVGIKSLNWKVGNLVYIVANADELDEINACKDTFTKVFEQFRSSQEFKRVRKSWTITEQEKETALSLISEANGPEHIYGRCIACQPGMVAET